MGVLNILSTPLYRYTPPSPPQRSIYLHSPRLGLWSFGLILWSCGLMNSGPAVDTQDNPGSNWRQTGQIVFTWSTVVDSWNVSFCNIRTLICYKLIVGGVCWCLNITFCTKHIIHGKSHLRLSFFFFFFNLFYIIFFLIKLVGILWQLLLN